MANVRKDSVSPPPSPLPAAAANDDTQTATERQLLRKTKIKSSSTSDDTHFPGPLFPSSRRTAAPPLMPFIRHPRPPPSGICLSKDSVSRTITLTTSNFLFGQIWEDILGVRQRKEIATGHRLANAELAIINPPEKSQP
uniref:Uncharacterized protein n=1 Tax=Salix viminalis TaxID=40686 RepID=A0A6N2K5P0_SALVM